MTARCPVCGFPEPVDAPFLPETIGDFEFCPSCGFQFGVTDDDRGISYAVWRRRWVDRGMPWSNPGSRPPQDWNPEKELAARDHGR